MMTRADRASLTVGCLLYLGSAPLLPFLLVISSPSVGAPAAGTWEWWVVVLGTMFRPGDVRPIAGTLLFEFVVGSFLVGRGLWRAFGGLRFTIGRMMVAVMLVALGLASPPLGFMTVVMTVIAPVLLTLHVLLPKPVGAPDERLHESGP